MGILPFKEWLYHLSYRKAEVTQRHRDVLDIESDILAREAKLREDYADLQRMTALNGILLLSVEAVTFDAADWRALNDASAAAKAKIALPAPLQGDPILKEMIAVLGPAAAAKAAEDLLALKVGTGILGKILGKGTSKLIGPSVQSAVSGLVTRIIGVEAAAAAAAEGAGEATLLGIEASTFGTIASTGIGIVIGLGLDIIFDAINGAVERDQLDAQLAKLDDAVAGLKAFRDRQLTAGPEIETAIAGQRDSFAQVMAVLAARDHPDFDVSLKVASAPMPAVLDLQRRAALRYGQFFVLRTAIASALARNPTVTADGIIDALIVGGPDGLSRRQLLWYWDVLAVVDPAFAALRPAASPDLVCSAIEARVAGALAGAFRVGWIAAGGAKGASDWSPQRSLGLSQGFDLAALKVPAGAQAWVEVDPLGGSVTASLGTTRFDPASRRTEKFALKGALGQVSVVRDAP